MPRVNWLLLAGVIAASSSASGSSLPRLASAYGVAVFGRHDGGMRCWPSSWIWKGWRWGLVAALAVVTPFLIIDLAFFGATLSKLFYRGGANGRCCRDPTPDPP